MVGISSVKDRYEQAVASSPDSLLPGAAGVAAIGLERQIGAVARAAEIGDQLLAHLGDARLAQPADMPQCRAALVHLARLQWNKRTDVPAGM